MTNRDARESDAVIAQRTYQRNYAVLGHDRFPLVAVNEDGCFLEDKEGREFFAFWREVTR